MSESLQSQVNNFTLAMFGEVEKVDLAPGVVGWELPCNLAEGLESDPRVLDEGVACYFLRLMRAQIEALRGPAGAAGLMGNNGYNGYTVTTGSFTQPADGAAFIIPTIFNPVLKAGEIVFIGRSGWYQVLFADNEGNIGVTLIQPQLGATGIIPAGRLVIPTGPKGQDLQGPVGDLGQPGNKGDKGEPGDIGEPGENGQYLAAGPTQQTGEFVGADVMTDFQLLSSEPNNRMVKFTTDPDKTGDVTFRLTSAGKYLFRMTTLVYSTGGNPVVYTGFVDTTNAGNNTSPDPAQANKYLPGSFVTIGGFGGGVYQPVSCCAIVETTSNYTTIQLQAFGKDCRFVAPRTTVTWVRVT